MSAKKKNDESKKKLSKKQMKKLEKMRASKRDDAAMRKSSKKCDDVAMRKAEKKREKTIRKAAKKLGKSLSSCSDAKGSKTPKKNKAAKKGRRPAGAASFKLDLGTCPCCSKRCPLSKPKCGKGRAVARKKRERLMGEAVA